MGRYLAVALAVLALAVVPALSVPVAGHAPDRSPQVDEPGTIIEVGDAGDRLWPYTSRSERFEDRTLVINAIVTEDPERARELLGENVDDGWERTKPTRQPLGAQIQLAESNSVSGWRHAHGSIRYTYVENDSGEGAWLEQRYQLHVGTYLGSRHHVRAFAPAEESSWTALQAHSEYWDWFRLRHTVTDVRGTADMLESEFQNSDVRAVERRHQRNARGLDRGIVVVSALAPLVVGITSRRAWDSIDEALSKPTTRDQALVVFGLAAGIPLGVRAVGIGLEDAVPLVTPKLFVVVLYPCLAVGLPVAVAWYAADLPRWLAAPAAAAGLALGFTLEFAMLGLVPPDRILQHRLLVTAALGALAAGGGDRRSLFTVAGVAVWVWGLFAPLFGFL
ncbi:hypothetical protein [Haloarcula onubensis]|uniref:Uncharacterized protein n=1 Tax=Haloarcula onubensis TaxID=2950539 RepID=A0ABU2FJL4_9EURY|nr:hypothetical protein [Halomicroarcula sp. S3CR25-11]MDS0280944.1 hypothetical protein [Halomicroarcula sp. S3CR25-11]